MKKIYSLISAIALSINVIAQAPVPTSYDFENGGTYPSGWTLNPLGAGTQYYTTSFACGNSAYSLKLDTDLENLVISLSSQPGVINYNLRANTGSATPFSGNFQVQESADGTNWTAIKTYTNGMIDVNTCTAQSVTITNTAVRYVRFYLFDKVTGNVCIDDVNILAPVVPVGMRVKQAGNQVGNGEFITPISSAVSSTTVLPLTIENFGNSTTLNISSAVISGVDASDFVATTPTPININASSNTVYNINFTPSSAGTKTATLTYTTNDPSNTTYIVKLFGTGGSFATTPSSQANTLTFPVNKTYRIVGQFNTVNSSLDALSGYIILRKTGSAVTEIPVNGTVYKRGQYIGGSQVVFSGPITTSTGAFSPSYIRASNTYGFAIFTYNGEGSVISYNTTAPLSQTIATPYSMMNPTEYAAINTASTTFLTDLSALINPHTSIFYSNYTPTMIDKFETRDTFLISPAPFSKVITCAYSGMQRPYNDPFDYTALDFSREHSYCHNWMPTNPANTPTERPEYNDQHNLYPTKQVNVNAVRSNYPVGVVTNSTSAFMGCKFGTNALGKQVFEPRAQHKGNVARAIMYMATAYNGISGNNWKLRDPISGTIAYGQDQDVLKAWHFQDLPDSYERSRNDFLDSLQGNRNPFIDSVRYACYIDFTTMSYLSVPSAPCPLSVGIKENVLTHFEYVLAPNPSTGEFSLFIDVKELMGKTNLSITDVAGRNVYSKMLTLENGFNTVPVNDVKLQSGIYFVNVTYKNEKVTRKLVIQ